MTDFWILFNPYSLDIAELEENSFWATGAAERMPSL